MPNYQQIAADARKKVLDLIYKAQTSHIGSNLSCIDILTVLFDRIDLNKDKFILSAGWKAAALYYFLWRKGKITIEELNSYCKAGSKFIGLSEPIHKDIPFAGGSMGMGLPAGVGFALAKKLKNEEGKVYVLMSDGELQCGTTWESLLIASQLGLYNLCVIIDANRFQAMGEIDNIVQIRPIFEKFRDFRWDGTETDGHSFSGLSNALDGFITMNKDSPYEATKGILNDHPYFIIAHTIKGKGVSFMENNNLYHYKILSKEEYNKR